MMFTHMSNLTKLGANTYSKSSFFNGRIFIFY